MRLGETLNKAYYHPTTNERNSTYSGEYYEIKKTLLSKEAIRIDENGKAFWIDLETGQKIEVPLIFRPPTWARIKHPTAAKPRNQHMKKASHENSTTPTANAQMNTTVQKLSQSGIYTEHKPSGTACEVEPVGQPKDAVELFLEEIKEYRILGQPISDYYNLFELFGDYNYRIIKIKETDVRYYENLPRWDIPFMPKIPEPEMKLLREAYRRVYGEEKAERLLRKKIQLDMEFRIVEEIDEKDRKLRFEIDRVKAGKYQMAYAISKAKDYAIEKAIEMVRLGEIALKEGIISLRDLKSEKWKEQTELEEAYLKGKIPEEEYKRRLKEIQNKPDYIITHHNKIYLMKMTFTLPKFVSEKVMELYTKNEAEYKKLKKAIRKAVENTIYKLAYFQMRKEGLFGNNKDIKSIIDEVETINSEKIKRKILLPIAIAEHITNSTYYGRDESILLEDAGYRNENDPFSPHYHFHTFMLNIARIFPKEEKLEKLGVEKAEINNKTRRRKRTIYKPYYRISPYINEQFAKILWRNEVIRELRKAGFKELAEEIRKLHKKLNMRLEYKELIDGNKKKSREEIILDLVGAIKYVKRTNAYDVGKYFYYNDNWEEILKKYDEKWILHVMDYIPKTEIYGLLRTKELWRTNKEEKKATQDERNIIKVMKKEIKELMREKLRRAEDDLEEENKEKDKPKQENKKEETKLKEEEEPRNTTTKEENKTKDQKKEEKPKRRILVRGIRAETIMEIIETINSKRNKQEKAKFEEFLVETKIGRKKEYYLIRKKKERGKSPPI